MHPALADPSSIHAALWRGNQISRYQGVTVSSGVADLDAELPGNGWPCGALIDVLLQNIGIGEMRLLAPALRAVGTRPLMMLNPPHVPNHVAFSNWGVPIDQLAIVRAKSTEDTLWAAEQILRAGTCGALLYWQDRIRNEHLRRLQLAASATSTLFFVLQPIYSQGQASPAALRVVLRPALDGVEVEFVKRRGPPRVAPLFVPVGPSPILTAKRNAQVTLIAPTAELQAGQNAIENV